MQIDQPPLTGRRASHNSMIIVLMCTGRFLLFVLCCMVHQHVSTIQQLHDVDMDVTTTMHDSSHHTSSCAVSSGTTTATVLTRAILAEGCKSVAAGMNPMDLRRGINLAVEHVLADLKKRAKMISTTEEIAQVTQDRNSSMSVSPRLPSTEIANCLIMCAPDLALTVLMHNNLCSKASSSCCIACSAACMRTVALHVIKLQYCMSEQHHSTVGLAPNMNSACR